MGVNVSIIRACLAGAPAPRRLARRDLAGEMGLSERELVAAHVGARIEAARCGALSAVRLKSSLLMEGLAAAARLGPVEVELRNAAGRLTLSGDAALIASPLVGGGDRGLSGSPEGGERGYAVSWCDGQGLQRRLQVFDVLGALVVQLRWLDAGHRAAAWSEWLELWADPDQRPGELLSAPHWTQRGSDRPRLPNHDVPVWWVGHRLAEPVDVEVLGDVLSAACHQDVRVSMKMHAGGLCAQVSDEGLQAGWGGAAWSLSGEGWRMALDEQAVDGLWWVRRPTAWGLVHTLEGFDADGRPLLTLGAAQERPGPMACAWRRLLQDRAGHGHTEH